MAKVRGESHSTDSGMTVVALLLLLLMLLRSIGVMCRTSSVKTSTMMTRHSVKITSQQLDSYRVEEKEKEKGCLASGPGPPIDVDVDVDEYDEYESHRLHLSSRKRMDCTVPTLE